jgi:hypothetical protein
MKQTNRHCGTRVSNWASKTAATHGDGWVSLLFWYAYSALAAHSGQPVLLLPCSRRGHPQVGKKTVQKKIGQIDLFTTTSSKLVSDGTKPR